jgi:hypothetical protein
LRDLSRAALPLSLTVNKKLYILGPLALPTLIANVRIDCLRGGDIGIAT